MPFFVLEMPANARKWLVFARKCQKKPGIFATNARRRDGEGLDFFAMHFGGVAQSSIIEIVEKFGVATLRVFMDKDGEQKIVRGLQAGGREAWLGLYEAYAGRVWTNVCRIMGFDCAGAADVLQETFLMAARSAKTFDEQKGSLWMWLWGIARRQVALYYRKRGRKTGLARAQLWWARLNGEKDGWIDVKAEMPAEIVEADEMAMLVRKALGELSAEYQALLLGKYVDGLRVERIAEEIGCTAVAVRSRLGRARKAFRKSFREVVGSTPDDMEVSL